MIAYMIRIKKSDNFLGVGLRETPTPKVWWKQAHAQSAISQKRGKEDRYDIVPVDDMEIVQVNIHTLEY